MTRAHEDVDQKVITTSVLVNLIGLNNLFSQGEGQNILAIDSISCKSSEFSLTDLVYRRLGENFVIQSVMKSETNSSFQFFSYGLFRFGYCCWRWPSDTEWGIK